jgi:hypothetical protein
MIHMTKKCNMMYRQQKKVATSITIALKHCLKKAWWVPPAIWLGSPIFNL